MTVGPSQPHHEEPEWGVFHCPCGQLYLKLGPVRLEFSPAEFQRLHILVRGAVAQFRLHAGAEGAAGHDLPHAARAATTH